MEETENSRNVGRQRRFMSRVQRPTSAMGYELTIPRLNLLVTVARAREDFGALVKVQGAARGWMVGRAWEQGECV